GPPCPPVAGTLSRYAHCWSLVDLVCDARFNLFLYRYADHGHRHSFPTRRSSDLAQIAFAEIAVSLRQVPGNGVVPLLQRYYAIPDRKSTRLNSSHVEISYAVSCLTKKRSHSRHTKQTMRHTRNGPWQHRAPPCGC